MNLFKKQDPVEQATTMKQLIKNIYKEMPELANDDVGLLLYIMNRHGMNLSRHQQQCFRDMGNPEHWTRVARRERAEHPELVNEQSRQAREEEFIEYKYNNKAGR